MSRPVREGWVVTTKFVATLKSGRTYPLLPGDLLTKDETGRWWKECPGMMVAVHFHRARERYLEPINFVHRGLSYAVVT